MIQMTLAGPAVALFCLKRKSLRSQLHPEIDHIRQKAAGLIDGVVIVPDKEILHHMGAPEPAPLIKRHSQRALAGAHL